MSSSGVSSSLTLLTLSGNLPSSRRQTSKSDCSGAARAFSGQLHDDAVGSQKRLLRSELPRQVVRCTGQGVLKASLIPKCVEEDVEQLARGPFERALLDDETHHHVDDRVVVEKVIVLAEAIGFQCPSEASGLSIIRFRRRRDDSEIGEAMIACDRRRRSMA